MIALLIFPAMLDSVVNRNYNTIAKGIISNLAISLLLADKKNNLNRFLLLHSEGCNYESVSRYAFCTGSTMIVDLHGESSPSLTNRQDYRPTGCDE